MDTETARFLNELNQHFYDTCASSFSDTRVAAWPGWQTCLDSARAAFEDRSTVRILDVACGNMRFESFLADELGKRPFAVCAVDTCEALAHAGAEAFGLSVRFNDAKDASFCAESLDAGEMGFVQRDIISCALLDEPLGFSGFDMAVCFGFFHHVPGHRARQVLLDMLCETVRPGGVVAISLWRFADDERLARKACEATEHARTDLAGKIDFDELDEGDAFLGWQEKGGVYRYAHSFSDEDVEALIEGVAPRAKLIARFRSDGRTGDLNEYLLLRKL